nr:hypothetical protein [Tanacetum cinerariifolium]
NPMSCLSAVQCHVFRHALPGVHRFSTIFAPSCRAYRQVKELLVQSHRCISHSDVEAQSIPKNIISLDPGHQGETFVKLVDRHLSFEPIDKLLAKIFDRFPEVGSLEKSMAAKYESEGRDLSVSCGVNSTIASLTVGQQYYTRGTCRCMWYDVPDSTRNMPKGTSEGMKVTSGWKGRPNGRDVRIKGTSVEREVQMEGTPEWKENLTGVFGEQEDQEGNNSTEIDTLTYHVLATYRGALQSCSNHGPELEVSSAEKTIQDAEKIEQWVNHLHLFQTPDMRVRPSER